MNKAVFLDRDGTINVEKKYLYKIEDFEFLPGSLDALKMLQDAGYLLIVITNQSGIARGYYKEEDFKKLNKWMLNALKERGINISKVYYCPHHPNAVVEKYRKNCNCRKPKLGLYEEAIKEFDLDLKDCWAIGDKIRDCSICKSTGCKGFLIGDNESANIIKSIKEGAGDNIKYAENLYSAAVMLIKNSAH